MPAFSIDYHKGREDFTGTPERAVRQATGFCYLAPHMVPSHAERLEQTGRTTWSYGFSTVVVTLESL